MQDALSSLASELNVEVRTVYNPFFAVADNLASCWMARHEMYGEFIQVNGDNLFKPDLVEHFLASPEREVTVAVNHKETYDADDMKVMMDGERVTEIGKMLPLEAVDAEAMGFYYFRGEGGPKFVDVIERMMLEPSGLKHWYPTAVGVLAKSTPVHSWDFDDYEWCEVDFPADLQHARQVVSKW